MHTPPWSNCNNWRVSDIRNVTIYFGEWIPYCVMIFDTCLILLHVSANKYSNEFGILTEEAMKELYALLEIGDKYELDLISEQKCGYHYNLTRN